MVHWPASRSKALDFLILLIIFLVIGVGAFILSSKNLPANVFVDPNSTSADEGSDEKSDDSKDDVKDVIPEKIDFQPVVDAWAGSVQGNRSVLVYDIERDEIVGAYNTLENYDTASIYKLFVVYEGYRRVDNGSWDGNATVGSTRRTINDCLDLAIRESDSPCAEGLWAMMGHAELDAIVKNDYGINNTNVSNLISNVTDVMMILKRFYEHPDIKDEGSVGRMMDSFLNQPTTNYNWRQGLPSGFSKAKVYNKVGWDYNATDDNWNIYNDAAIVEFPEQKRHFIVVVMTNKVAYQSIATLGTKIENTFFENINN